MTKYITIAFDDGPREPLIQMVDKFKKFGMKAAFAVVGKNINDQTEYMLKYAIDNGFQLISHSQTHCNLTTLETKEEIKRELLAPIEEVERRLGYKMTMARFPYNQGNDMAFEVAKELGLPLMCSGINNGADWNPETTVEHITNSVLNTVSDGVIATMHVTKNTCLALDVILPTLIKMGYQVVTPEELFRIKGISDIPLGENLNNIYTII